LLDHPFDHPDDPTGSSWIRRDRRGTQPEQGRSVWSRPGRRGAPGYGSGGWGGWWCGSAPGRGVGSRTSVDAKASGPPGGGGDRSRWSRGWGARLRGPGGRPCQEGLGERRDATCRLGGPTASVQAAAVCWCTPAGQQPLRKKTDSRPVAVTGCGLWGTSFEPGGGDRGGIRGGGLPSPSWRPPHARDADAVGPDGEPSPRAPGARRPAEQADGQGSCTTLRRIGSWPHLGSCVRVEARRRRLWTCLPSFGLNLDLSTAVERSRWSWRLRLREVGHSLGHATYHHAPGHNSTG